MTSPDSRTYWRCRRGMLENDWLLGQFLAHGYVHLDQEGRDAFDRLLDYPDHVLLEVVMGRQTSADAGIARLVPAIRATAQAVPAT